MSSTMQTTRCVLSNSSSFTGRPSGTTQRRGQSDYDPASSRTRSGGTRTWRPLRLKMALRDLLWRVAIETGPGGLTRRTQASTEVPRHLWCSVFPQGEKVLRVQCVSRLPAKCIRVPAAPLPALVPQSHHHRQPDGRSAVKRRDRRSKTSGNGSRLPPAWRSEWWRDRGAGNAENGVRNRTTSPTPASASCPGPKVLLLFAGSAQRVSILASCLQSAWVTANSMDLADTHQTSRMSLITSCGRWSAIGCNADHSASWLRGCRHPHSRHL